MKVAILGFDIEGKASFDYFKARGDELTVCDQNPTTTVPDGTSSQLGGTYLDNLARFDLLVRTPGLHPSKILAKNPSVAAKITSGTNEFMRVCPSQNIIGVTGTKGKGTTSTLIARLLKAAGKQVFLGGNIGVPMLSLLPKLDKDSWIVLELSNFQLIDAQYSPHIAVCLMVVPEHLNWHKDMAEYVAAKSHLFEMQNSDDIAIYFSGSDISGSIANVGAGRKLPFFQPPGAWVNGNMITIDGQEVCITDDLKLLGKHNWQNVCAALTAYWQVEQNISVARQVITSFVGLPHRLEKVRVLNGVSYYNDSFAATPDAAIAALQAIAGPKVMILGGFDRMLPISHLAKALADTQNVRAVIIGASAQRLAKECSAAGFKNFEVLDTKAMPEIVKQASLKASNGESVVLSPGFASFDMFKNFEDRGEQYREAVMAL